MSDSVSIGRLLEAATLVARGRLSASNGEKRWEAIRRKYVDLGGTEAELWGAADASERAGLGRFGIPMSPADRARLEAMPIGPPPPPRQTGPPGVIVSGRRTDPHPLHDHQEKTDG